MFTSVSTVMLFVENPLKAARWWGEVLDAEVLVDETKDSVYAWLIINGIEFGWHHAEPEKNPQGGSTVAYWQVPDLSTARQRLLDAGCTPHRGPLHVEGNRWICQITDPFGAIHGLEGPAASPATPGQALT